jgi:hypothetical protein
VTRQLGAMSSCRVPKRAFPKNVPRPAFPENILKRESRKSAQNYRFLKNAKIYGITKYDNCK